MGATNTTANYSLSQFIGTDKPAWLQDYNGDMLKIDTGINAAKVAADGAQNSADAAQNDATTANNAITNTINPAISSLNTIVGNQGGAINTINSLIGNGTPTTTDQTIIGAINEINSKVNDLTDWTELTSFTASANGVTVPNLSQFRFIGIAMISVSGVLINSSVIPYNLFKNGGIQCDFNDGTRHYGVASYVNDTTVDLLHDSGSTTATLYGIK